MIVLALIVLVAMGHEAHAAGSGLPWEAPLERILESIEGPVAKVIAVLIIIVTGLIPSVENSDRLLQIGLFPPHANRRTIRHLCIGAAMSPRLEIAARHSAAELRRLARHERDRRAAMRMIAIAESLDGADRQTAARRGDMSDQALRDAIKRYNAEGIDGLHDRPRAGRPTKLTEAQRSELRAIVVKGPDVEAEGLSAYTRDDLVRIVESKWGVGYDPTSVGRILRGLGLSRQKARPSHPKKDAAAAEAFKKGSGRPAENHQ